MRRFNLSGVCLSGLLAVGTCLVPLHKALGQADQIEGGTGVVPTVAHVNNVITIKGVDASESVVDNGANSVTAWLITPNNLSQLVLTNGTCVPGTCVSCPSSFIPACLAPVNCVPGVNFLYTVNSADIGQALSFTIPNGFPAEGTTVPLAAKPHYVRFLAEASGFSQATGLPVQGSGPADVLIVTPGISVTKQCVTNCAPGSSQYGAPIGFTGTICNTGDDTLINVSVTDTPPAAITFSTSTSYGTNGFPATGGGRLLPGECVNFSGVYNPAADTTPAALCGPFTDQVIAFGTEAATGPFLFQSPPGGTVTLTNITTVTATNTATCYVCTSPCLQVIKNCGPTLLDLGVTNSYIVSGVVTNCGNVPLTNVMVSDVVTDASGVRVTNAAVLVASLLPPGGTAAVGPFTITVSTCGPSADFLIASGGNPCDGTISALSQVCTTTFSNTPCLSVVKTCGPASVNQLGDSYQVSGYVTNCGSGALTDVSVSDIITDANGGKTTNSVYSAASLPGFTAASFGPITITPTLCGTNKDQLVATAHGLCSDPVPASSQVCSTFVPCSPGPVVLKGIACGPAADSSGNPVDCSANTGPYLSQDFGAVGTNEAAFCYQIIISNRADAAADWVVTNVTDNLLDPTLLAQLFPVPFTLAPGQGTNGYIKQAYGLGPNDGPSTNVNTVIASGLASSAVSGIVTQAQASATGIELPASVVCHLTVTNEFNMDSPIVPTHVLLPSNAPVALIVTVTNSGMVDLNVSIGGLPPLVDCDDDVTPVTGVTNIFLAVGESADIFEGCVAVECPAGAQFNVTVQGQAVSTSTNPVCTFDINGKPVWTAEHNCSASVSCQTPVSCRTTGGGTLVPGFTDTNCTVVPTTLYDPEADALGLVVDHISHGGQLGAPFSHQDCGQILADPCIRGEWEHVRHYDHKQNGNQDVIDMQFHSANPSTNNVKSAFDTLMCACLGCCSFEDVKQPNGNFTGVAQKFTLCNPTDHRICGPMPRPAPANALIFTGIGTLTPQVLGLHGKKAEARYVVFRVYIEDRSEPGGGHPLGAISPADVYCFQAWDTGISVVKKPNYNTIAVDLRKALAADSCAFIQSISTPAQIVNNQVVAGVPPGTLPGTSVVVNGVDTPADIVDQGPLYDGNRQIHPSTSATCIEP